jgi:CDP-glucose 4,6-dehydratase
MPIEEDLWRGRRVLLTGHTGFKGAWLSLWLQRLGALVTGVARGAPSEPSLYALARVSEGMAAERALDVRHREGLIATLTAARPEVVLHLAAQPLVRRSLVDPAGTYETNVIGTVNLLEAVRVAGGSVRAVVVVTSDKCYEHRAANASSPATPASTSAAPTSSPATPASPSSPNGPGRPGSNGRAPFEEGDPLGGEDPYSSSKACAEIVTAAYRRSFFSREDGPRVATARAGNVIGGGDWGEDRLLPDAVRIATGMTPAPLLVRNPDAVRPWQHVLNPLAGYLMLAQRLLEEGDACEAWNFGPPAADLRPVRWVLQRLQELWGAPAWEGDARDNPPEASWLALDSAQAESGLGWRTVWRLERALQELVSWHAAHMRGDDMRRLSFEQIERFTAEANGAMRTDRPLADVPRRPA